MDCLSCLNSLSHQIIIKFGEVSLNLILEVYFLYLTKFLEPNCLSALIIFGKSVPNWGRELVSQLSSIRPSVRRDAADQGYEVGRTASTGRVNRRTLTGQVNKKCYDWTRNIERRKGSVK